LRSRASVQEKPSHFTPSVSHVHSHDQQGQHPAVCPPPLEIYTFLADKHIQIDSRLQNHTTYLTHSECADRNRRLTTECSCRTIQPSRNLMIKLVIGRLNTATSEHCICTGISYVGHSHQMLQTAQATNTRTPLSLSRAPQTTSNLSSCSPRCLRQHLQR